MSEEIKERARAEAARILGTMPGCSTCLTVGQRLAHQRAMHEGFVEETREGWRADADTIARLTRELDEARDRIVALEAQLTTRGACECGADDVCALARRAQEAERERYAALRDYVTVADALGFVSTDDTGRIGAVGAPDLLVAEVRELEARVRELEADTRGTLLREVATYLRKRGEVHRARASDRGAGPHVLEAHALLVEQAAEGAALEHCPNCDFLLPLDKARCARCGRKGQPVQQWTTPTDPAPEQAGEGERDA